MNGLSDVRSTVRDARQASCRRLSRNASVALILVLSLTLWAALWLALSFLLEAAHA